MTAKRISLNNRIASKRKQWEEIEKQKSKLQTDFEENNESRIKKISQAFNIIMVVDNLYNKCINRDQSKQGNDASLNFNYRHKIFNWKQRKRLNKFQ